MFAGCVKAQKPKAAPAPQGSGAQNDKNMAVSPNVAVIFCGGSGRVTVRGWDKSEVRAVSERGTRVNLIGAKTTADSASVTQVSVMVTDDDSEESYLGPCFSNSNLDLYVPLGAFVDARTQEGDITVEKVAKASLKSLNGNFSVREIATSVQANSTSGDILVDNSSGQISVSTISGTIDVRNVKPSSPGDYLSAKATSGDVNLDRVNYLRVEGRSLSGDVTFFGALIKGAVYNLGTTSGDVTAALPANSSFRVNASVYTGGEIICDFPITKPDTATPTKATRLTGTHGAGDSVLNITAVNGTIHLRKK